jgi:Fe2+ or Zn2+ uptake regulation protein
VLETFVRLGIVSRTLNDQDKIRFDPDTAHHDHVVCKRCHKIVDLESGGVRRISLPDGQALGFEIQDYSIHFLGICDDCREADSR